MLKTHRVEIVVNGDIKYLVVKEDYTVVFEGKELGSLRHLLKKRGVTKRWQAYSKSGRNYGGHTTAEAAVAMFYGEK